MLLLAAVPIVAISMSLSKWAHSDPHAHAGQNRVSSFISPSELFSFRPNATSVTVEQWETLRESTRRIGKRWRGRLAPNFHLIERPPFVLAGDVPVSALEHCFEATIAPAAAAMARDYFAAVPDRPITVLMLQDEASYRRAAKEFFGQEHVSIYGYYKPSQRTVVINLAAGAGTIVHELTHALIDFDFDDVPIWFNEGLASFHEQCNLVMTEVGPVIEPLPNWRLPILKEAIVDGELPTIRELLLTTDVHGRDEAIKYAHARYFCLFLHERGVLQDFYRAFRDSLAGNQNENEDKTGTSILAQFFPDTDLNTLDSQFRRWAMTVRLK
jgi:hypothetical protein